MSLKCVPFNAEWTGSGTKKDMRAVYRRRNGDLMPSLPMRQHHQWAAKGYEYVTLADADSFALAVPFLRSQGLDPHEFVVGRDGDGRPVCWNLAVYNASVTDQRSKDDSELAKLVAEFGVEMVEKIKGIRVPDHLRPKVEAASEPKPAKRDKAVA